MLEDAILQVRQIPLPAYTTPPVHVDMDWGRDAFSFVKEHTQKSPAYPSSKQAILCDFGNLSITYSYRRQPE